MKENSVNMYENENYIAITWKFFHFFQLNDIEDTKTDKFRTIAWKCLNYKEKESIIHSWQKADVQFMENIKGSVGTVAVLFETRNMNDNGYIVVYIDEKTLKITGTETFY